ncbi:uncharacterized protein LOC144359141 [Saccoglossus kowalevskii]
MAMTSTSTPPQPLDDSEEDDNGKEHARPKPKNKKAIQEIQDTRTRRRYEALQRLSARMRHRASIVNKKEKNRLRMQYNQIDRSEEILRLRVKRVREQLERELHDMEACRRAYISHPMSFHDTRREVELKTLEKYAPRGRYLFVMKSEVRKQSDEIDSYNPRVERAKKLVAPARQASLQAIERSRLLRIPTALKITRKRTFVLPPIDDEKRSVPMRRERIDQSVYSRAR